MGRFSFYGDYIHTLTPPYQELVSRKTPQQIFDPVKYDNLNMKQYLAKLKDQIQNPEPIQDIINSEDESSEYKNRYKKIQIKGSALNDNYSLLTFYNVNAQVYVKNLAFVSSLQPDEDNPDKLVISNYKTKFKLPTSERLIAFYPLKSNFNPEIGYALSNQITVSENTVMVGSVFDKANTNITNAEILLQDCIYSEVSGLVNYMKDQYVKRSNNVFIGDTYLRISELETLYKVFSVASSYFDELNSKKIVTLTSYLENGILNLDRFASDADEFRDAVETFQKNMASMFGNSYLPLFLMERYDIWYSSPNNVNLATIYDDYLKKYFQPANSLLSSSLAEMTVARNNIINYFEAVNNQDFSITCDVPMADSFTQTLGNFKQDDMSHDDVNALYLETGRQLSGSPYLRFSENDVSHRDLSSLFKLIFSESKFEYIAEEFPLAVAESDAPFMSTKKRCNNMHVG